MSHSFVCFRFTSFSGNHLVYRNVVDFCRHFVKELEGEADACQPCGLQLRQEAVVVAFAATEAMASSVESHTGNDGKLYLVVVLGSEQCPRRFSPFTTGRSTFFPFL